MPRRSLTPSSRIQGKGETQEPMNLETMLEQLDEEIARLEQARAMLTSGNHGEKSHAPATAKATEPAAKATATGKRKVSPAARKRMAEAQRARWAKVKKATKAPAYVPKFMKVAAAK
jgi:hypothetical protein